MSLLVFQTAWHLFNKHEGQAYVWIYNPVLAVVCRGLQACLLAAFGSRALWEAAQGGSAFVGRAAPRCTSPPGRSAGTSRFPTCRRFLSPPWHPLRSLGERRDAIVRSGRGLHESWGGRALALRQCSSTPAARQLRPPAAPVQQRRPQTLRGSPWCPARASPPAALLLGCRIENRSRRVERSWRDGQSAEQLEGQGYLFFHLFSLSFWKPKVLRVVFNHVFSTHLLATCICMYKIYPYCVQNSKSRRIKWVNVNNAEEWIIYVGETACVTLQIFFSPAEPVKERLVLVGTDQIQLMFLWNH